MRLAVVAGAVCGVSCRQSPTHVVLHERHVLSVGGVRRACEVEIRSDRGSLFPDPHDETTLRFQCAGWSNAFTRELNSCLVERVTLVRWMDGEGSLLLRMRSRADFAMAEDSYLLFRFGSRALRSNLYGVPFGEACIGRCAQGLREMTGE